MIIKPLRGMFKGMYRGMFAASDSSVSSGCVETPADYLICQNFEGAGYDNSETWTETPAATGGVVDPDDTTATILRDSQQLKLYGGTGTGETSISGILNKWTDAATVWAHFRFKTDDNTPASNNTILNLMLGSSGKVPITLLTSGKLRYMHLAVTADSTFDLSGYPNGTMIHIWIRYTAASAVPGNDGIGQLYVGTTSTRPALDINITTGTQTALIDGIRCQSMSGTTSYYDQILVDTDEIGDVCD